MYIGQTATKFKGAKPYMARKFIAQRGQQNLNNDQQINRVRHTSDVRYSLDEAIEIFIQAKEAEGIRKSTINGYYDTVRYFKDWLNKDINDID